VRRALERVGDQISGVLQRAHETAEQITAQSRMEAEDRLERARREGLALIETAERRVRELDADADRVWAERARIVADAEALSGQLLAVARDAAARFPDEENRAAPTTDRQAESEEPEAPPGIEEAEEPEASAEAEEPEASAETDTAGEDSADADDSPDADGSADADDSGDADVADVAETDQAHAVEDPTEPIDPTERIRLSQDDSTRIIPPSSDAARRREG
jgi:hypothetical protein